MWALWLTLSWLCFFVFFVWDIYVEPEKESGLHCDIPKKKQKNKEDVKNEKNEENEEIMQRICRASREWTTMGWHGASQDSLMSLSF